MIEKIAGKGHFATVYMAWDRQMTRWVALKTAHLADANAEMQNPFSQEAGRLFQLQHPHIVDLLDYTILDDRPTLVMEYIPSTLRKRYKSDGKRQKPLPPAEMLRYLEQAASALEYAHKKGVIHCDIKPENILLDNNGLLKISDFGIAMVLPKFSHQKGRMRGTEGYIAPEGYPGPLADQYSLAVTVYEGLVGHKPGVWKDVRSAKAHLFPDSPVAILLPVVTQALARKPDRRFRSVQDFADAFEQAYIEAQTRSYQPLKQLLLFLFLVGLLILFCVSMPLFSLIHIGQKTIAPSVAQDVTVTPDLTATAFLGKQMYQRVTAGTPSFSSSLSSQDSNRWQVAGNAAGSCLFTSGVYQISSQRTGTRISCLEQARSFKNMAYQVELLIASTPGDYGGIMVRASQDRSYYFLIGTDESYKFGITNKVTALAYGFSTAIFTSIKQWNQLAIIVQEATFYLYINKQFITAISDSSVLQGFVGLSAEDDFYPTQVQFRNAQLWQIT